MQSTDNIGWFADVGYGPSQIAAIFETLDGKYETLKEKINAVGGPPAPALVPEDSGERPPEAGAAPWEE